MTDAWTIKVGDRLYGPFSLERVRGFAPEGRLAPTSLVAPEGSEDWREAGHTPEFADIFASQPGEPPSVPEARPAQVPSAVAPTPAPAPAAERAQFAVVVDIKSGGGGDLEQAIMSLGPAYRLLPNIWIVSTEQTINAVRNRLVRELGKADSLFVVDASRGKAAWFNFGPDADVRIRRVWQKTA